jgi:DNA-binding Lrp family transcriptional regulator
MLNVDVGKEEEVFAELRKTEGVTELNQLFGVYDAIVMLEAESTEALRTILQARMRKLDGVRSTLMLMAASDVSTGQAKPGADEESSGYQTISSASQDRSSAEA